MQTLDLPRDAIAANNVTFAAHFAARDAGAVASLYTTDADLFPPGMPGITGRAGIAAFWAGAMDMGLATVELTSNEVTDVSGDLALECGSYRLGTADGSTADEGKYMVLWRLVDGAWYLHRDMWNTSRSGG